MRAQVIGICLIAVCTAALPVQAAGADDFCAIYKALGADAKGGFTNFSGPPLGPSETNSITGWTETKLAAKSTLPGAISCDINWGSHPQYSPQGHGYYECTFAPTPTKVDMVASIAEQIVACTGMKPSGDAIDEDDAADSIDIYDLPGDGFHAALSSIASPPSVSLHITE